jgi:hypothetical protein
VGASIYVPIFIQSPICDNIYICNDYFPEMRMSSLCGCVHKLGDVFMVKVSLFDQLW